MPMPSSAGKRLLTCVVALGAVGAASLPLCLMQQKAVSAEVPISRTGVPLVAFSGRDSRITRPAFQRIASSQEWESLWKQHTGQKASGYYNTNAMPRIDFDTCMVIAIFSGPSITNNGAFALSVTDQADKIVLRYSNLFFQIGTPDPKALENPRGAFGFFVLPRSSRTVVLEESVVRRMGEAPVIKVRAQLPG